MQQSRYEEKARIKGIIFCLKSCWSMAQIFLSAVAGCRYMKPPPTWVVAIDPRIQIHVHTLDLNDDKTS